MGDKTAHQRTVEIGVRKREEIYKALQSAHEQNLLRFGVTLPWADYSGDVAEESIAALQLIVLYKHIGTFVHKDDISDFVRSIVPDAKRDQQIRHLGSQRGWNVLNKGEKIPGSQQTVPAGFHILLNIDGPKNSFFAAQCKRVGRISATNFEQLKAAYGNRCATCGSPEGKTSFQDLSKKTELQQGHKEPSKALTLENTIPQCQLCNQTYKGDFVFDDKGRTSAIASSAPVLRASEAVQRDVWEKLNNKYTGRTDNASHQAQETPEEAYDKGQQTCPKPLVNP